MSSIEKNTSDPAVLPAANGNGTANVSPDGREAGGSESEENSFVPRDARHDLIAGWGVDIDLQNDPTYPIKRRTNGEHAGKTWERPAQQEKTVAVLMSVEHKSLPAVFGTTLPPSGVSGALRKFAFRYSESDYLHWLPLMLADRINVVEGRIKDLAHGYVPNVVAERGLRAEWKYNRKKCVTKAVATAVIASAAVAWVIMRKKQRKNNGGILQAAAGVLQDMSKVS